MVPVQCEDKYSSWTYTVNHTKRSKYLNAVLLPRLVANFICVQLGSVKTQCLFFNYNMQSWWHYRLAWGGMIKKMNEQKRLRTLYLVPNKIFTLPLSIMAFLRWMISYTPSYQKFLTSFLSHVVVTVCLITDEPPIFFMGPNRWKSKSARNLEWMKQSCPIIHCDSSDL